MIEDDRSPRQRLYDAVMVLDRKGLVSGTSGNASLRLEVYGEEERYLITPAKIPYSDLQPEDLIIVDQDIEPVDEETLLIPSTEALLHLSTYKNRPDVKAVVHTHSIYASVAAVRGSPLPPIVDEMMMYLGGSIEVSDYGFPGTEELADNVVHALGDRGAVLIRHHGMMAVGSTIEEALERATLVERVAEIFLAAEAAGGAVSLPDWAIEAGRMAYMMNTGLDPGN